MSDRFVIEIHEEAAGIVIRDRGGFRFFSADPDYSAIDGHLFRDVRAAELAARRHFRRDGHAQR